MGALTKREVAIDFADATSAHGFASLKRAESSCLRAMWTLAMLAAWTICGLQVGHSIYIYLQYKTDVSVKIQTSNDMVSFPAITICNLNPMRKSHLANVTNLGNLRNMMKAVMTGDGGKSWDEVKGEKAGKVELTPEEALRSALYSTIYTEQLNTSELGHQMDQMMLECTFQGRQCFPQNFTKWQHAIYGNCYTTILSETDYAPFVGSSYGFSISLNVQDDEYLDMISQASGFRIHIHPKEYIPQPDDLGFSIAPDFETSVAVTQTMINRKELPYDDTDCHSSAAPGGHTSGHLIDPENIMVSFNDWIKSGLVPKLNYTLQLCLKNCYFGTLAHRCDCADTSIVTWQQINHFVSQLPPNGKDKGPLQNGPLDACDMGNEKQLRCVRHAMKDISDNATCDNSCPQPCHHQMYKPRVTMSHWPRGQYLAIKGDQWMKRQSDVNGREMAKLKLAKMLVYFEELNYESITESASFTIQSLLSDIGGTLGLYAGMSFLTILEFIELCIRWGRAKRQPTSHPSSAMPPKPIGPNSFYVPK